MSLELQLILIANMHLVSMMFIGAVQLSFFVKIFAREKRFNAFPKRQIVIAFVRLIGVWKYKPINAPDVQIWLREQLIS